jgi:hypothetical protein
MKIDNETAVRIAEPLQQLRSQLDDEQLDALDELMEYLLSLDEQERQRVCGNLKSHIEKIIEDNKPVN